MSFQDIDSGSRPAAGRRRPEPGTASVASAIFQINTAVAAFRKLVDAIGTTKDTPELRQKINDTRQRIGQLVKETSAKLRALTDSDHSQNVNASKKVEHAKLAKDFQAVLLDYQKVQQLAAERELTYTPSLPASSFPTSGDSSQSNAQTSSDIDQEQWSLLRDQKRQEVLWLGNEVAFNEAIIEEREQGFKDIQEQIVQANEIFKDLAVLVHEQGITIDDIDSNIEASHSATLQAKTQLAKASKSVKSRACWRFGKKMVISMGLGQTRGFATPTAPRLKSFAATAEDMLHKPKNINVKAEFVPVCVMAGMVVMATLFGVHTAKQQLLHSPNVHLRKKKREIVPEVYQPEQVLEESDKYLHNSFFRRVAHIQDHSPNPVPDTIHGNALLSDMRSETLKSVGIEP